jgi:large subunit ribosomal protein L33
MAKKGEGCVHIMLKSTESDHEYHTIKNKRKNPDRIELKKYDPTLRRKVTYRESKSSK